MSYGFNNNTYKVLKQVSYRDVFKKVSVELSKGCLVGSGIANAIIATEDDQLDLINLEGQAYIDAIVAKGYIAIEI